MKEMINEILAKIGFKAVKIELESSQLDDGVTVIEYESLEAGSAIWIVSENGNVPLPVGDYMMEDGTMIVVAQEGVIAEVKSPDASPVPEAVTTPAQSEAPTQMTDEKKVRRVIESTVRETQFSIELQKLKDEVEALKSENESLKLAASSAEEKVELSDKPAAQPIVSNPEAGASKIKAIKGTASIEQNVKNFLYQ